MPSRIALAMSHGHRNVVGDRKGLPSAGGPRREAFALIRRAVGVISPTGGRDAVL
jgi:hypothetical protein